MDFLPPAVTDAAVSRLVDWGKAQIGDRKKQKEIARLIDETAIRAPAASSSVDLAAKFGEHHLVEELLAHRELLNVEKHEAIRIFLGDDADDSAYEFVEKFWDSVNAITLTGEESLADRKAVESIEAVSQKIDFLLEAVGAAPSDREVQKKALSNYCKSLAQCHDETALPRFVKMHELKEPMPQFDLARGEQSILIYGDPGVGKSVLLKSVAADIAKSWINSGGDRIPVLIDARGWFRQYTSLAEGVAREVFGQATALTEAFIRKSPSLFCLFVDGLDEVRGDKDLLFAELARYAKCEGTRLICSSRFKEDCSRIGINNATLLNLSDEEVVSYLKDRGIDSPWSVMHRFNSRGRELMRNPLHLNCLVEYLRKEGTGAMPRNLAAVYGTCIATMIETKPVPDDSLDADYLQQQLGSYALECLTSQYVVPYRSYLIERFDPVEADRIEKAGKASGLLIVSGGAIRFSHAVFQEYLAAIFLAGQDNATIEAFCEQHSRDPLLKNFFEILCGCTTTASKQALILDCLERSSLTLFMDCLRARMNLSDEMEKRLSKEDIEAIAKQALKTYTNISNLYLAKMKPHIPFWRTLSNPDALIRMEVDYSMTSTVIHITLKEMCPDNEQVHVRLFDDEQGPVAIGPQGSISPIFSMRMSNQPEVHVYRIGALYEGIDCAREMAISMINDDLKGFFESAETILDEPIGMRAGFVEEALRRCRVKCEDSEGRERPLSLRRCTANGLTKLLAGTPDYIINVDGFRIPTSLLPILVRMLEIEPEDQLRYLPPEPDNLCGECRWIWEIYKDETFEEWCSAALLECEKSYRQFVHAFMEELGEYLPAYADGPFVLRVAIKHADNDGAFSDRSLYISCYPIGSEEEARVELTSDFFPRELDSTAFEERAQDYARMAKLLGRPGTNYYESSMGGLALLTEPSYIHKEVRKRIRNDVKTLFSLH